MKITDIKDMYTIEVNTNGTIVHEMQKGFWTVEDFKRFQADYISKVAPLIKGKKWAKCSDLTEYKTSSIATEIQSHIAWAADLGLTNAAIILNSAVVKMQMNRGAGNVVNPKMFDNKVEAISWLESEGYKK
ncbi:hypothetical protein LGK97_07890 [Clostridium sp. CS001]|uniref:hypothetical protein n=1 Tax=Clostridium sp. CS001 TaxID=2880648 RepID=UPI001CF5EAA6|nr:hypothetical protein [Clostridium sp. CS001]MCB2289683.1 hypothetical protein [Clostridium sp. CS001]